MIGNRISIENFDIYTYSLIFCDTSIGPFYLKEFLFYLSGKMIFSVVGCQSNSFIYADIFFVYIILFISCCIFSKENLYVLCVFVVSYFFIIGFTNIYRQGIAELWLLFFLLLSDHSKWKLTFQWTSFVVVLIHNVAIVPLLVKLISEFKIIFIGIALITGFTAYLFVSDLYLDKITTKSIVNVGSDFSLAYVLLFFLIFLIAFILRIGVRNLTQIAICATVLVATYLLFPGRPVERLAMFFVVLNMRSIVNITNKIFGKRFTPLVLTPLLCIPIFTFNNVRLLVFGE